MELTAAFLALSTLLNIALVWLSWRWFTDAQYWEGLATYWQHLYEQWMAECGPRLD
jgi:hypothetical protein